MGLADLIGQIGELSNGGTMAVQLACHALARGYEATIYTYNLFLFDPTWFGPGVDLAEKLIRQCEVKRGRDPRIEDSTESYLQFLKLGGQLKMEPLEDQLLIRSLTLGVPVLCGLSATFLYQESRERPFPPRPDGISSTPDDIAGDPVGHFVVLSGYSPASSMTLVHDPHGENPLSAGRPYQAALSQVTSAILLGIATYDANLLTIQPKNAN